MIGLDGEVDVGLERGLGEVEGQLGLIAAGDVRVHRAMIEVY